MIISKFKINISDISNNILFFMLFLITWIIFGGNSDNADYQNYNAIYDFIKNNGSYSAVESGFEIICILFIKLGFDYQNFLVVYSFIGLLLVQSTVRKLTKNHNVVWLLYFVFPFLLDVVQIRNFMSMSIIVFAIRFLLEKKHLNIFKFIVLVLLASTFHVSSLFYLLLLLTKFSSKTIAYLTIVISLIIQLVLKTNSAILMYFLNINKLETYLSSSTSFIGVLFFLIYLIINLIFLILVQKAATNFQLEKNKIKVINLILKINIIMLISYNFLIYDADFIRLQRNLLILNYVAFSIVIPYKKISKNKMILFLTSICVSMVFFFNWIFIISQTYESVLKAILHNNVLFDLF